MTEENTRSEPPQSITIKAYYKGYSVLLTMKDPKADPQPLIERAIYAIDWIDGQRDFKPNWKQEAPPTPPKAPKPDQGQCPVNHAELPIMTVKKEGANKGRTFQACPKCNYFKWIT